MIGNYNPTEFFIYKIIKCGELVLAQRYQRDIVPRAVQKIVDGFDPLKLDPLKVVFRDGKYYVYDGQHRLIALTKLFGKGCNVPCLVLKNLKEKDEAVMFAEQDCGKQKVSFNDQLRARFVAGDKDIVAFHDAVEDAGYDCNFYKANARSHGISAWRCLYTNVYKRYGSTRLTSLLSVAKSVWGDYGESTSQYIVQGLNCFMNYYEGEYDNNALIKALRKTSPKEVIIAGRNDPLREGAERHAAVMLAFYNKRKGVNKLPIKF